MRIPTGPGGGSTNTIARSDGKVARAYPAIAQSVFFEITIVRVAKWAASMTDNAEQTDLVDVLPLVRPLGNLVTTFAQTLDGAHRYFRKSWDPLLPEESYARSTSDDRPWTTRYKGLGSRFPHATAGGATAPDKAYYDAMMWTPWGAIPEKTLMV